MSKDRQNSRTSKGIRLTQVAAGATLLIAAAGAWYGFENVPGLFGNSVPDDTALSEAQSAQSEAPISSEGYLIREVPGSANRTGQDQRSGAARFARDYVANAGKSAKGRLYSNSGKTGKSRTDPEDDDLVMPEWARIVNPDGSAIDAVNRRGHFSSNGIPDYADLYSAFEAGYVDEVISDGVATDMSALLIATDVSDEVLYNGAVSAAHDLGNFLYMLTTTPMGNLRFYFGIERLRTDLPTFIEFELNQQEVQVGSGIPWWHINGSRRDGDLLVRFNLISGNLSSVELAVWFDGIFHIFETDTDGLGQGCKDHFSYIYCIGAPPIDRSNQLFEVRDENSIPVEPRLADSFVELGIDMSRLMGSGTEFSSIYVRTPEDVLLASFAGIGNNAGIGAGGI